MKRRVTAFLAALALSLGAFLAVTAQPASAQPLPCTDWSSWLGTTWGAFRWCSSYDMESNLYWYRFQVDDKVTDGYAVHVEVADSFTSCCPPTWQDWNYEDIIYDSGGGLCFQSVGPIVTSDWPGTWTDPTYPHIDAKLVRGRICGTGGHQNTASLTFHLAP